MKALKGKTRERILFIVLVLSVVLNIVLLYMDHGPASNNSNDQSSSKETPNSADYPLLSKRIFVENQNDVIINFTPLRKAIRDYIDEQKADIGIYFEYLPSGISISMNGEKEVRLASLSKVPIAMSVLRKVEKGSLKLDDVVTIKKEELDSKFGDLWRQGEGARFSVKQLLEFCLEKSDNTAYNALFDLLTAEEITGVYNNLDIEVLSPDTKPTVSPKSYSSILRSLYLASYLNVDNSNYLLDILTKTVFSDKIPAGVPDTVKVAHKIGVFETINKSQINQIVYTDCGIVYFPNRPYIICAFVRHNEEDAKKYISYLSHMIYTYIAIARVEN